MGQPRSAGLLTILNVLRSKLLDNQCRLNTRFLRIRHLDALPVEEDLVRAFQMEVDANDCLLEIGPARLRCLLFFRFRAGAAHVVELGSIGVGELSDELTPTPLEHDEERAAHLLSQKRRWMVLRGRRRARGRYPAIVEGCRQGAQFTRRSK